MTTFLKDHFFNVSLILFLWFRKPRDCKCISTIFTCSGVVNCFVGCDCLAASFENTKNNKLKKKQKTIIMQRGNFYNYS